MSEIYKDYIMEKNQADIDISFCLPIYNVSPWLKKCIDSILAVEGIKFEVICVDDMSTDDSYAVLLDIAKGHDNIIVKRNDVNRGVSYSRNAGLNEAKGKYVWFVDPDDMIESEIVKSLYEIACKENADVITADYDNVQEDDHKPAFILSDSSYKVIINDGNYIDCCGKNKNGTASTAAWTSMFRRNLLLNNKIIFNTRLDVAEDIIFNFDVLRYAGKIVKYNNIGYYYRCRRGSSSTEFNEKRNIKMYKKMYNLYCVLDDYIVNKKYRAITGVSSLEQLQLKQVYTKENVVRCLAMVRDTDFIKKEMKKLEEENIYPYKFRRECLENKSLINLLVFLLPIKLDFWLVHFLYGFKKRVYQHNHQS